MNVSCENIAICATSMTAANLLFFAGVSLFWERKVKTRRGSAWVFAFFLAPFILSVASVVMGVYRMQSCRAVFCSSCLMDVPLVLATWTYIDRSGNERKSIEAKVGEEENHIQGKEK